MTQTDLELELELYLAKKKKLEELLDAADVLRRSTRDEQFLSFLAEATGKANKKLARVVVIVNDYKAAINRKEELEKFKLCH